jgi:thioredoxin 1
LVLLGLSGFLAYCQFTSGCLFASTGRSAAITNMKGTTVQTQVQDSVIHADETTFREQVLNSKVPVLVDFYADWCGPCRALAPVLEELAQETPNAKVVKVNVDESPQLAARYGISSIPSLLVFRDGKIAGQQVGLANKQQLRSLLVDEQ